METSFPDWAADRSHLTARGKRGRKSSLPDPDAGPVARFAHDLGQLKLAAGDPSYDRMRSELGAAASKSALSAAARGQTLPSWETTWEFVRCLAVVKLGKDEQLTKNEWRARWEHACTAELGEPAETAVTAEPLDATGPDAEAPEPDAPEVTGVEEPEPERRERSPRAQAGTVVLVAVLGVVLVGATLAAWVQSQPDETPGDAAHYPIEGDDSGFGSNGRDGDVTVPDGTVFHVGDHFVKTWRLNNLGEIPWDGRFLQAFGDTDYVCSSPDRVPIPHTEPGELVDVSVPVTAKRPGHCRVEWKMVDARGRLFFPSQKRGVFYDVVIQP